MELTAQVDLLVIDFSQECTTAGLSVAEESNLRTLFEAFKRSHCRTDFGYDFNLSLGCGGEHCHQSHDESVDFFHTLWL